MRSAAGWRTVGRAMAAATLAAGLALAAPAAAQVGQPSDDDFKDAPPQFREALSNGRIKADPSELTRQNIVGAPPSADPRDMNGMYNYRRGGPAMPPGGPPPGSPPAAGGKAPPGGGRPTNVGARACLFSFPGIGSYSTTILLNERTALVMMEENHGLRWARFAAAHPTNLQPSYSGDSIARWDGNTLVIDTVGVKAEGTSDLAHYVERFTKQPDGNVAVDRSQVAADGTVKPIEQGTLRWRPDLHYVEDICEDFGEAFGVDYKWWAS